MLKKMKKISLVTCLSLAATSVVGGLGLMSMNDASAESARAKFIAMDKVTKSAWETAGYGTEGYFVFGVDENNKPAAYSNMYTAQGNNGKTEMSLYKHTDNSYYYDSNLTTTDEDAPISKILVNGQSAWQQVPESYWVDQPDLYVPGAETTNPVRMHNNHDSDPYRDIGVGFTLTETDKTYVTVYVLDWSKKASSTSPITVGLFSGMQATTVYAYGTTSVETIEQRYGEALAETTVMSTGSYVTFAIEGAGDYQIVAYYDNEDPVYTASPVTPMMSGLFFDADGFEDDGVSSTVNDILVDNKTKSAWQDGGYGEAGYMVFGAGTSLYSNMYTEQGNDGTTAIKMTKNNQNAYYYDAACTKTMDSNAPISSLTVNGSSIWQEANNTYWISQPDLYVPNTETFYPVRMHNNMNDAYNDIGLGFTLTATEKTYISVYVMDWAKRVNNDFAITVGLYSGIKNTTFTGYGNNSAETFEQHYGTALMETKVTSQGAYVTFAVEGVGDYQIVAHYDNPDVDEQAKVTPMMTGLFFDTEIPDAQQENVVVPGEGEFVGYTANYTGADWERLGYGTDGYVVYYTPDDNTYQAYTKGIYKNADGSDYTGLVTYTGLEKDGAQFVKDARDGWVADKELSGKLITRYASAFNDFNTIVNKSWKDDFAAGVLTIPGTTDPTWTRISTSRNTGDGNTAFTIPASAFEEYDAIDVTIFHTTAFGPTDKPVNFKTALFNMYNCGDGDNANDIAGYVLSEATISLTNNAPLYVTYRITAPGDYTVFLMSDDDASIRATTTGVFFDYVTGVMSNITYDAVGATHNNPSTYVEGTLLPLMDASKEGYTFDGWYTDSEYTNKITEVPVTTTGDITLYAKFTKIYETFNITYVLDGGTHENPATYLEGTGLVLADASKDGYRFVGWYTDEVFTEKLTTISTVQTGDITLYARFAKIAQTFNITYVADGGVHNNPETYSEGSVTPLMNAMKSGYTFEGWYTDSAFTNQVTEISEEQTGDITLYAKFVAIATPDDSSSDSTSDSDSDSVVDSTSDSVADSDTDSVVDSESDEVVNSESASVADSSTEVSSSEAKGGCGSVIGGVSALCALIAAGVVMSKKKED